METYKNIYALALGLLEKWHGVADGLISESSYDPAEERAELEAEVAALRAQIDAFERTANADLSGWH